MNPMDILAPNYIGNEMNNLGTEMLSANLGWGVPEAKPKPPEDREEIKKVKRGAARQFGRPMESMF